MFEILDIDCSMSKPSMFFQKVLIAGFPNKDIITFLKNGKHDKAYAVPILTTSYYYASLLYYDNTASFYADISNLTC